jgi:acetyl-CoA C-acetyltransferase
MKESVIVSAVRTPTGKFLGVLKDSTAPQLGALVVREAVARAGIDPALVDECIMGNVLQAGNGQNPARQAALNGGLDDRVAAMTINKVCGSGLKAVMLAAQGIATGDIEIAVAGGMESMSNAPYLLPRVREGLRMGNGTLVDSVINDGLWCSFEECHMGMSSPRSTTSHAASRIDTPPKATGAPQQRHARAGSRTKSSLSRSFRRKAHQSSSIATSRFARTRRRSHSPR